MHTRMQPMNANVFAHSRCNCVRAPLYPLQRQLLRARGNVASCRIPQGSHGFLSGRGIVLRVHSATQSRGHASSELAPRPPRSLPFFTCKAVRERDVEQAAIEHNAAAMLKPFVQDVFSRPEGEIGRQVFADVCHSRSLCC